MLKYLIRIPSRPILWMASALHLAIGIGLVLDSRVSGVTGIRVIAGSFPPAVGLLFLFTGLLALWGIVREAERGPSAFTFWSLIPQQALLMVIAAGVIYAVSQGHYSSGTVLPRSFILVDQFPKVLLAMLHPFGVISMHWPILPKSKVGDD